MPVRKIPKNYLVVTGSFAGRKTNESNAFESLLEKDYMLLLDFDEGVLHYEVQPVKIPVPGKSRGYTPDILIHFKPDPVTKISRRPQLAEVKTSAHLIRYEDDYRDKFSAAKDFALERGWEFTTVTESEIRTPRLANIKFLREYRSIDPSMEERSLLREAINSVGGEVSVEDLLNRMSRSLDERLRWLS